MSTTTYEFIIKPNRGWQSINFREMWVYRELLGFLIWRDIKIRYKQTMFGSLWAIFQPLIGCVVFGLMFSRVAPIRSDGPPYALFVYAGLVPWTFFSNAVGLSSTSLVGAEQMIRKIYFPRLFLPLGSIIALGMDMLVSLAFMGLLMIYYHQPLTSAALLIPVLMVGSFLAASGTGLFLAAVNVKYRDVKYLVSFLTQMMFFLTPVIYPVRDVPESWRPILALNPMAGMIEGFRFALLGSPISLPVVTISSVVALTVFILGVYYFRRMERTFADLI